MYFLDTNTCIYFLKNTYPSLSERWLSIPPKNIKIPAIVKAELLFGAYKSVYKEAVLEKLAVLLSPFEIIPFTDEMTLTYAEIRSRLERKGQIIGPNDLLIASIVKYNQGILVTHNVRDFSRVKDLKLESWGREL